MKIIKIISPIFIFNLVLLSFFLVGCQLPSEKGENINVAGHAEMSVEPDLAKVYMGISILKPTAVEAQNEANKVINDIIDGLRYKGILESDIETETLNVYEDQQWDQEVSRSKSVGWRATQTLKINTNDLAKVGDIVDVGIANGANQINSIEFYLSPSKDDESKQLVLAKATQSAKKKAETIADSLGVKLDKLISASESNYVYTPYRYAMADTMGVAAVQESAKVMPSEVLISADMTLMYSIKQT